MRNPRIAEPLRSIVNEVSAEVPVPNMMWELLGWMTQHGYATGHGDNFTDILDELRAQIRLELVKEISIAKEQAS